MVPLVESKFGGWGAWGGVNHSFSLQGQKLAEHLLCARPHSRQWGAAGNKTPFPCEVHLLVWEDLTRVGEREEGGGSGEGMWFTWRGEGRYLGELAPEQRR